jgi:hypothetical protein
MQLFCLPERQIPLRARLQTAASTMAKHSFITVDTCSSGGIATTSPDETTRKALIKGENKTLKRISLSLVHLYLAGSSLENHC